MDHDLATFYDLTRRTRSGVLDWLESLPADVPTRHHDDFAYGSLAAIHAHVAETYLWWVGSVGLGRPDPHVPATDVAALREAFASVDATIVEALLSFTDLDTPFEWTSPRGQSEMLTRRWLILHPITHEFHHKGQALALARALGHPHHGDPDTDLVTP